MGTTRSGNGPATPRFPRPVVAHYWLSLPAEHRDHALSEGLLCVSVHGWSDEAEEVLYVRLDAAIEAMDLDPDDYVIECCLVEFTAEGR